MSDFKLDNCRYCGTILVKQTLKYLGICGWCLKQIADQETEAKGSQIPSPAYSMTDDDDDEDF